MTDEEKLKNLDPKNPFTQAIKDWSKTPERQKKKFYKQNAGIIDRWQSETEALQEDKEPKKE